METIQSLVSKINEKTKDSPIIFVTADLERGLGLEDLLDNYKIIYSNPVDYSSFINTEKVMLANLPEDGTHSSARILDVSEVSNYLSSLSEGFIQTFKISAAFEKKVEKFNLKSLNTSSKLNRLIEDKISQHKVLSEAGLNYKKTIISELEKVDFSSLQKEFGQKLVIQFGRGHTGSGTMILDNESEFNQIKEKFPKRQVKISEFIETEFIYNVNGCITNKGNYWAGLNFQLTGINELTPAASSTVGNDFKQRKGIEGLENQLLEEFNKIGNVVKKTGFRGMLGIDFVVKDREFYLIEINARQTASIPFHSKLQIKKGYVPLNLIHLAEFLGIEFDIPEDVYNHLNLEPINASQVFLRSKSDNFKINLDIKSGFYRLQSDNTAREEEALGNKDIIYLDEDKDKPLIFKSGAYSIDSFGEEKGMLILTQSKGTQLNKLDEIARIQLLSEATDSDLKLYSYILEALTTIENLVK